MNDSGSARSATRCVSTVPSRNWTRSLNLAEYAESSGAWEGTLSPALQTATFQHREHVGERTSAAPDRGGAAPVPVHAWMQLHRFQVFADGSYPLLPIHQPGQNGCEGQGQAELGGVVVSVLQPVPREAVQGADIVRQS